MKTIGLVFFIIAFIILVLGIISPLNIIFCTLVAVLLGGFGVFVLFKFHKNSND